MVGCNVTVDATALSPGVYRGETRRLLESLLHDGLSHVILAHLSQINNLPEIAYEKARETLETRSCGHIKVKVARQDTVGTFCELKG